MSTPTDTSKPTHLTTDFGAPVPDNQNSLTAGPRGPLLAQDVWLHEKLGNFVREVIPERRMHAKGSGAFEVGEFELNRNSENFFADVEQSAFAPSNLVPGISVSPDKMLQARLFNYADAQRYRLGTNYQQIPVNAARCPVHSNHRDGIGRVDGNYGSLPHYEPNSFNQWQEQPQFREPPLQINGDADHWDFREDDADYYKQPGDLFRLMTPAQQQVLFDNTARAMGDAPDFIKQRHVDNCSKADAAYGAGVAASLRKLGSLAGTTSPNSLGDE